MKVQKEVNVCDACQENETDTMCLACKHKGQETWVCQQCGLTVAISDATGSMTFRLCPAHAAQLQKAIGMSA